MQITGGNTAEFRFSAERFEQNDQVYIIGTGVDITKQKELEGKLNASLQQESAQRKKAEADREKLKEMFEEPPTPKCVMEGPEFRYVIANKAYQEVVGQQTIIGKKLTDVIPEVKQQGYVDLLEKVYQTGEPYMGRGQQVEINKEKERF
ncbi:MAG: PAS domain-containing protein [Balneolaceae bacterium]|nr:PAS domain-containing protein [Balneolaceae bacterium]